MLHKNPFGANLYQKLPIFAILRTVSPHFESHNSEIWSDDADLGLPRSHPKFCTNRLRGLAPRGKINNKKFHIFTILVDFSPHFLTPANT